MDHLDDLNDVMALPSTIQELYLPPGTQSRKRPFLKGDPFQGDYCILPKPEALVSLFSAEPLSLIDRRVLNVLLAASWRQLRRGMLWADVPMRHARIAAGLAAQGDNRRLIQSILRLRTVRVDLWPKGARIAVSGPLLAGCAKEPRTARLLIAWNCILEPVLKRPVPFAPVDLSVARALRSRHALILYEHLAQRAGLKVPLWSVELDILRSLLGIQNAYQSWRHLRRTLEAALSQIRSVAGLEARMDAKIPLGTYTPEKLIFRISQVTRDQPGSGTFAPKVVGGRSAKRDGRLGSSGKPLPCSGCPHPCTS